MTEDLLQRFHKLNVWKSQGRRAPHKPLLALWAIGRCLRRERRLASYQVVDRELGVLLSQFGPHRVNIRTDYPFWHMRNDDVWEVDRPHLVRCTSKGDARIGDLKRHRIRAGFKVSVVAAFQRDPALALQVAGVLVSKHFPSTLHEAILEATSIPTQLPTRLERTTADDFVLVPRRRRDPTFRRRILAAYGSRCAVCEFDVRFQDDPLALEAAHVKWHEAKGPADVANGLSLCALHHELFDSGAFTLLPDLRLIVAEVLSGTGLHQALRRYHGKPLLAPPLEGFPAPAPVFLKWHAREVFKEPKLIV